MAGESKQAQWVDWRLTTPPPARWQIRQKRENGETLCVTAKSNLADRMAASLPLGRLLLAYPVITHTHYM